MMDLLHNLQQGFATALTFQNILYCSFGVFFGQMIGVLPGIGAPTAIALLLPLTFTVDSTSAIIMFAGIYYGVAYGGTITSILINVPGESSTVMTGLDFIVVVCGMFGVAEVFNSIEQPEEGGDRIKGKPRLRDMFLTWEDWVASRWAIFRGTVIGFLIGLIPAGGITTASFIAYLSEKRYAKHPERFGRGAIEGVAAPESANNAASISGFAPLLALGIPGSATTAVMLAGFMMWGIRPGPLLFSTHPKLVWGLIASMYIGNFLLLLMNIFLIPVFTAMLRVPYSIMMGGIVIFSSVGAFSVNNNLFDVWMMLGFALLAYVMLKLGYPIVPLILALVLGKLSENSLRQALMISGGTFSIFATRPISAVFLGAAALAYMAPLFRWALARRRATALAP